MNPGNAKLNARLAKVRKDIAEKQNQLAMLQAKERDRVKKVAARRKYLVGEVILMFASNESKNMDWLLKKLDSGLSSDRDRALFDLPPRGEAANPGKEAMPVESGSPGAKSTEAHFSIGGCND